MDLAKIKRAISDSLFGGSDANEFTDVQGRFVIWSTLDITSNFDLPETNDLIQSRGHRIYCLRFASA